MFNTRRSTLDPHEKYRKNKQTEYFTYLDRCLQIPCDDKLIIRNLIKNENQIVTNSMNKYKKEKNLGDLQVSLRKIVKNFKSEEGTKLWMRPDRILQSGNKEKLDRSKQSKQMLKSIGALPKSNSKEKHYGQYRKTPENYLQMIPKNSPKKILRYNEIAQNVFPTSTSSKLSNQTRNSMSQRFIFQSYNTEQSNEKKTQEQQQHKVDEVQKYIQYEINKQIQNQYNNMSDITLNAKDITVRQDQKSCLFDEQSMSRQKCISNDFIKYKEYLGPQKQQNHNVYQMPKSLKYQQSSNIILNDERCKSNSVQPQMLQKQRNNYKYQHKSWQYHQNSIQTEYNFEQSSRNQLLNRKNFDKNQKKGVGVAAMVKDFLRKPNLIIQSQAGSRQENSNSILFKKNKENVLQPTKNSTDFYNKLINCMNSQKGESHPQLQQSSNNQETILKHKTNQNSPSVNNFLSLSEKNRFVIQEDQTQQLQSFRHNPQLPINEITINVDNKYEHNPSKRRQSKNHRMLIDQQNTRNDRLSGNSVSKYGYTCWGKDSQYQRSQSDSGPYKQTYNFTENKYVGNKNLLASSFSNLPNSKSKLQITKKLGYERIDSDFFRTDYMTASGGSYILSSQHQTDQDSNSNHNCYNDILGLNKQKQGKIPFQHKLQVPGHQPIKKYPFGQFYKRIQEAVDGDI